MISSSIGSIAEVPMWPGPSIMEESRRVIITQTDFFFQLFDDEDDDCVTTEIRLGGSERSADRTDQSDHFLLCLHVTMCNPARPHYYYYYY